MGNKSKKAKKGRGSAAVQKAKAFFHGADKPSPSALQNNDNISNAESPLPLVDPANHESERQSPMPIHIPGIEATQSPSLPEDGNGVIVPQLFSPNNNATPLSAQSGSRSNGRPRLTSRLLLQHGSGSTGQTSRLNETSLFNGSDSLLQPKGPWRPRSSSNQSTTSYTAGDVFNRVQQVSVENANIYEVCGDQNFYGVYGDQISTLLQHIAGYAMLDTTYDSSARDPPPRCHPGTRLNILRSIQEKLHDPEKKAQVDWLQGAAGVGKSAIMQTVAEAEAENNTLGASLFFSRPNKRDDPRKAFPTVAYQLAVKEPSYRQYLMEQISTDPLFFDKTLDKQFTSLIEIPFAQRQFLSHSPGLSILLDGLDECKGSQEQCRIIKLIRRFVSNHPNVPLRWVIASRPEEPLRIAFSKARSHLQGFFWENGIPVDSEQSVRDVELYLHKEFKRIRKRYPDLIVGYEKWPSETQFLTISRAASGLFVFASTVILFIDDDENPVSRLGIVVAFLEKRLEQQHSLINPLALLDALYEQILSVISSDSLNVAKLALGYLFIITRIGFSEDCNPFSMCNILGFEQHVMYGALRKLRSVLDFPEPKHAHEETIRFLHASFSDYLKDPNRSDTYSVNLDDTATYMWWSFMSMLKEYAINGSHDGVKLSWSTESLMKIVQSKSHNPPNSLDFVDTTGYYWMVILQHHFEKKSLFRLSLSLEEIMEQIKGLDFSYPLSMTNVQKINEFISCINQNVPPHLREEVIQDIPLASLSKNQILKSVCKRKWILNVIPKNPFEELDPQTAQELGESLEKLEMFLRDNSAEARVVLDLLRSSDASKLGVTLFGARPSKCRVVIQDILGRTHSFPYIV